MVVIYHRHDPCVPSGMEKEKRHTAGDTLRLPPVVYCID